MLTSRAAVFRHFWALGAAQNRRGSASNRPRSGRHMPPTRRLEVPRYPDESGGLGRAARSRSTPVLRAYTALGLARPVANVRTGGNREATETGECAGHGLRIEWFAPRLARAGSSSGYRCAIDHVRGRPRAFSVGKGRRLGRRFALSGGVRSRSRPVTAAWGARRARSRRFRSRTHPGRPPGPTSARGGGLAAAWGRQSAITLEADERAHGPERDEARRAACSSLGGARAGFSG